MSQKLETLYNLMLIAASTYGLTCANLRGKKFAITALALYWVSGCLRMASIITNNQIIEDVDYLLYVIVNTGCVDLVVFDVCVTSGVDPYLSAMILIPPALDLIMRVVDTYWSPITSFTHIFSSALLFYFAIRDSRPILIVAGMSFLFAIVSNYDEYYDDVAGYNAIAVFCSTLFLEGKDFKDFGF